MGSSKSACNAFERHYPYSISKMRMWNENEKTKIQIFQHDEPLSSYIFLVKMSATIGMIKQVYATKKGVPVNSLALLDDGIRVNENTTLNMLDPHFINPDQQQTYRWHFKIVKV